MKDYDKTIDHTEAAYKKIIESSHTLLRVLKSEVHNIDDSGDDEECRWKIESKNELKGLFMACGMGFQKAKSISYRFSKLGVGPCRRG